MKLKKFLTCITCSLVLITSNCNHTHAIDPTTILLLGSQVASVIGSGIKFFLDISGKICCVSSYNEDIEKYIAEKEKYGGYRDAEEIVSKIKDIVSGKSQIKIYGQIKAKEQCFNALAGCLERIHGDYPSSEKRGNIVYMIGSSGTGKTTMARAISDAFLKHSDHTCCFIECSNINKIEELGTQLFRTVNKVMNLRASKEKLGYLESILLKKQPQENIVGGYDARVASRMLEHLLKWDGKAVVIIDEYDKMKKICRQHSFGEEVEDDKTADEILKSIASNGYYMMGTEKIDCSKTLFLITTNESREQLEKNFGQNGITGGGAQRLNIIEFEKLDKECSKNIVKKMIKEIRFRLTDKENMHNLKNVIFSDETIENMANYITNNDIKQGRSKYDLSDMIYGLCVVHLQEYKNKSVEIVYVPSEKKDEIGRFEGKILKEPRFADHSPSKGLVDYSSINQNFIDYSEVNTNFVDYSEN